MSSKYIASFDQGTTSCRVIIFNEKQEVIVISQKEFNQIFPNSGWVEHNPIEIWETQLEMFEEALEKANLTPSQISAIGITNQRETIVVWDKSTGKPIYNAIVWQDTRTVEYCNHLKKEDYLKSYIQNWFSFRLLFFGY